MPYLVQRRQFFDAPFQGRARAFGDAEQESSQDCRPNQQQEGQWRQFIKSNGQKQGQRQREKLAHHQADDQLQAVRSGAPLAGVESNRSAVQEQVRGQQNRQRDDQTRLN